MNSEIELAEELIAEGPCADAFLSGRRVMVEDLRGDRRYRRRAAASVLVGRDDVDALVNQVCVAQASIDLQNRLTPLYGLSCERSAGSPLPHPLPAGRRDAIMA